MKPSLSRHGLLIAVCGAVFVIAGTLLAAWPLVALGFLQISSLLVLYLLFVPHAVMFRRRQLEFAWWVPASEVPGGVLTADKAVRLHMLFRNHSPLGIVEAELSFFSSRCLELAEGQPTRIALPAKREIRFEVPLVAHAVGHWFLQGLAVRLADRFGVYVMHAYFPNLLELKVFPALGLRSALSFRPQTGTAHERAGPRLLRRRGLGSDLRELREHSPGDPFKRIAWKASARTGKLMVREYESEILVTHQLLLDISPSMRSGGSPGLQKIDTGIALCAGLCRVALDGGDRVGFTSFDTRIYGQIKAGDGPPQLYRIMEQLLQLHCVVDDDLTDLTDGELCSAVADYLAYQEGTDVRLAVAPERGSAHWDDLVVGSSGELIDLRVMARHARSSLAADRRRSSLGGAQLRAADPQLALLRRFCRLRGIELPYRRSSAIAGKVDGLVESLTSATASRASRFIVLISDLLDVDAPTALLRTLQLARRKRHHIVVVVPSRRLPEGALADHERRIEAITELSQQGEQRQLQRSIEALGIPVLLAREPQQAGQLIAELGRLRGRPRPARPPTSRKAA